MATDFILSQLMCGSEHKPIRHLTAEQDTYTPVDPWAPDGLQCYSKGPENFRNFATTLDNAASVWFLLLSSVIVVK